MILEKAAGLFNSRGYFGASMSDVMEATGLEKGGIYNHFGSKDELALAAFDYAVSVNGQKIKTNIDNASSATEKLNTFLDTFCDMIKNPIIPGGCPLLNCAVESDDAHPELRARVQQAMTRFLGLIETVVAGGIESGEFQASITPNAVAITIVSTIEGSIMLSKLYENPAHMETVINHLKRYIATLR